MIRPNKNSAIFKKETAILFFVLVITFFAFSSSLLSGFTNWDDELLVVDNPEIRSLDFNHIKTIFTSTASLGYIPLSIFSFAIEYHFFGLNPFVFHLDNLILHLVVLALLFFFGLRLGLHAWASGLAVLLFGIHPMHVESVAWISERKDVLYAIFYLLALHSHWSYLETRKKSFYALIILYGLLSMLAKPMALSLPLILGVLDWMKGRKFTLNVVWEKIPHFLYIIPLTLITYRIHAQPVQSSLGEGLLTWIWCSVFYIWKFFFPFPVVPLYSRPEPVSLLNPVYLMAIVSLIAFVGIAIRFRAYRWLFFAWLFYFFSIFFLFHFDLSEHKIVSDRYMYLPSVGFCFLFGSVVHDALGRLKKRKDRRIVLVMVCLAVLFGALSVKTFFQCRVWKDSLTLWFEMLRYNPKSAFAFYNRAKAYESEKRFDLAEADYDTTIALSPKVALPYNNRGITRAYQGREDEAMKDFNKTIELDPEYAEGYSNRAYLYYNLEQYEPALADLNKALELKPDYIKGYSNRALVRAALGRLDLALKDFNRAIEIDPSIAGLYYHRSLVYADMKNFEAARTDAKKAQAMGYSDIDRYMERLRQYDLSK